ncbi:MAG: DUF4268 domain-containing protein [Polyangia bacterium]
MEAAEAKVQRVLEGSRQFLVPHFQRPYSWRDEQWLALWRDLVELVEDADAKPHFLGSIVTSPARSIPEGVEKRLLIDGQQRLTTILILLTLIRDRARETDNPRLADKVQDLITNRHEEGNDHFKLLPTQGEDPMDSDRDAFIKLMEAEPVAPLQGIAAAYRFFASRLHREDAPDLEKLLRALISRLTLVSIILDEKDNAHRIFESLNGKGRPLTQADLIRNYFFMRIEAQEHDRVYRELWRPMQRQLGEETLPAFVRHYLMRSGETIRESDVYGSLKMRVDEDQDRRPVDHLRELVRFAGYYDVLLHPEKASTPRISDGLRRLNRLDVTVAYPFLLALVADFAVGKRSETEIGEALETLENFLIRRFVCGIPTHGLNKIFPPLYRQAAEHEDFVEAVRRILSGNARSYPRDADFRERLASARLYAGGERREKTKLILERLEHALGHKERVATEALTIEHVMPQTLTDEWKAQLGLSWQEDHDQLLHTLGNLTLTSYNSELGNASYPEKRVKFAASHVELNRYFETVEQWTAAAIERRAEELIERSLLIWPYFGELPHEPADSPDSDVVDVTGTIPTALRIGDQELLVHSWVDVGIATVEGILRIGEDEFRRVAEELPKFVNDDATAFRRSSRLRRLSNGAYFESNLSASALRRLCLQAVRAAGIPAEDWQVEYLPVDRASGDTDLAEVGPRYQAFFQKLIDELRDQHRLTTARKAYPKNNYVFNAGADGFLYGVNFPAGRLRVELYMTFGDRASNKLAFDRLSADRLAIEAEFGPGLVWERMDNYKVSRIASYVRASITDAQQEIDRYHGWAIEQLLSFNRVFGPRLQTLFGTPAP